MLHAERVFADRRDAGRRLGNELVRLELDRPLILALPRGGVPVGAEVARMLAAPLDLLVVRKIGAPGHPELGLGAIVDADPPQLVLTPSVMEMVAPDETYLREEIEAQTRELARRRAAYLGDRPRPELDGRSIVVVDDGIATGGTARAGLRALRQAGAKHLVLAVPVGPPDVVAALGEDADAVVCLYRPDPFHAVGLFYRNFEQTSDAEVLAALAETAPDVPAVSLP